MLSCVAAIIGTLLHLHAVSLLISGTNEDDEVRVIPVIYADVMHLSSVIFLCLLGPVIICGF